VRAAVTAISADSRSAARRFQAQLRDLLVRLGDYPMVGVERPQIVGPPYRFVVFRGFPYLAVYDAHCQPPVIMRVPHGAQDLSNLLRDLPQNDS
jgi:plasmid stabilization system protein ParE